MLTRQLCIWAVLVKVFDQISVRRNISLQEHYGGFIFFLMKQQNSFSCHVEVHAKVLIDKAVFLGAQETVAKALTQAQPWGFLHNEI